MPRKRSDPSLDWLPKRVYAQRDTWVYQPATGGKITLCKQSEGKLAVLKRYEQVQAELSGADLFEKVINDFYKSQLFIALKPKTQTEYLRHKTYLVKAFGRMKPNGIKPHHVYNFILKLAAAKGTPEKPANPTANRYKATLQKICGFGVKTGVMVKNPCKEVEKLKEESRERYIEDWEYEAVYNSASTLCKAAMSIAYLCMARLTDVVNLTEHKVLEDGILIKQSKTQKEQIKLWSESLEVAYQLTRKLPLNPGMSTIFLFNKPDGSKFSNRTIQAHFDQARKKARLSGFTFHDLKAKGISDFEGTLHEKQDAAGHTTPKQTANYDRKIKRVKPVK